MGSVGAYKTVKDILSAITIAKSSCFMVALSVINKYFDGSQGGFSAIQKCNS